ncbi:MAG: hypothetical protein COS14_04385 [Bacteroidetes bacterium CG02_land_8_20_14_3_00_31_25]|nr:protein BatD [Bacteroidota bacterium]PIV61095.1 MAG: hypothetical protein COS14_04385 [Bacteroidetes bacterium CG02_land_8_20_14_3_00_31_25]
MQNCKTHIITLFTLIIFIAINQSYAQDIQFTASSKNIVSVGEQFRLVFSLNNKPSSFKAPSLNGFDILMGPSTSSSSSIQIINGQVTQNVSYSYTYILYASKEGKFNIKPAEATVNGKTYKSNSLSIEVAKGNNSNIQQNNQNQTSNSSDVSGDDVFVRVFLNKTDVIQGEQIIATIAIYTKLSIVGFEEMKFPAYKGFWSDDLENPTQINLKQEKYNGSVYQVGVLKKTLLTPQHSGNITIEPLELTCLVQQRVNKTHRSIFDDFFGNYQNVRKKLVSPAITVHVKPLPNNKPADYSGAVGNFELEATLDNKNPKTNEAISYTLKLKGTGNLRLAELPKINFPSDFEQYDPKTNNNINVSANGTSGSKIINYLLIPRHPGEFTIPASNFSYYDLSSKIFKTLSTPEFKINVDKDTASNSTAIVSEFSKEDVRFLGSDIHYIKTNKEKLNEKNKYLISEPLFYLAYPFSLALFIFLVIWRRKQIKQYADVAAMKNKKANKVAQKRLQLANHYLKSNEQEKYYEEMTRAIWGYLSDKLTIPVADLSKEKANESLKQKNISDEIISELNSIIENCELARYSPNSDSSKMNEIYNKSNELISKLEQNIK